VNPLTPNNVHNTNKKWNSVNLRFITTWCRTYYLCNASGSRLGNVIISRVLNKYRSYVSEGNLRCADGPFQCKAFTMSSNHKNQHVKYYTFCGIKVQSLPEYYYEFFKRGASSIQGAYLWIYRKHRTNVYDTCFLIITPRKVWNCLFCI